jgi:hypothetical protein
MDEGDSIWGQNASELIHVRVHHVLLGVDERVEAEGEVDRRVRDRVKRPSIVYVELGVFHMGEPVTARRHAVGREVHTYVPVTAVEQILGPAAIPRGYLEDPPGRQERVQSRP